MKKLLYTLLAFVTLINVAKSQVIDIKIGMWGVQNIYLHDGKIKYESNSGETPFNTVMQFQRYDGSTQVKAQAIYVLDANGFETAISDSIFVTTSDFTQATGTYWSKEFAKTAKLQPNNKAGVVKLKWRYWDTYSGTTPKWSSYYYASKTYQTVLVTVPLIANVYLYYNTRTRDHFTTLDPDVVQKYGSEWQSHGRSFSAYSRSVSGSVPIYEFYNAKDGNHLTTANRNETDGFPNWVYQGIAFYAPVQSTTGTVPIHMFYNSVDFNHYVSPDRNATNGFPNWEYRGIVFYAFP